MSLPIRSLPCAPWPSTTARLGAAVLLSSVLLASVLLGACAKRAPLELTSQSRSGTVILGADHGAWAPADPPELPLVGVWIEVGDTLAYTYFDQQAGLSARVDQGSLVWLYQLAYAPAEARVLDASEIAERELQDPPAFLEHQGEQPKPGTVYGAWRTTPELDHRFHVDYPDDMLVVLVTETSPALVPEVIWVRVFECHVLQCRGVLVNQPKRGEARVGDVLEFDAAGVPRDRPPPAQIPGKPLSSDLRQLLIEHPEFEATVDDPRLWEPDLSVDPADRMPPIGRWFFMGREVAYGMITINGPQAMVIYSDRIVLRSMRWLPRGAELLTDEEIEEAGLPKTLPLEEIYPQPEPGTWGTWRLREELAWLFKVPGEPDILLGSMAGSPDPLRVRVTACAELACEGLLDSPHGVHAPGSLVVLAALTAQQAQERGLSGAVVQGGDGVGELPVIYVRDQAPQAILDLLPAPE